MGVTLDALHHLQRIQLELLDGRRQVESKRRAARGTHRRVAQLDATLAQKRDEIKHQQSAADRLELDRNAREAGIAKLREALNKAKTNKEYAAVLTQINTSKADNSKVEDRVLQMLTVIDDLKKTAGRIEAEREKESARAVELDAEAVEFARATEPRVAELKAQHELAAADIPPKALAAFNRAAERHDGEAMALVAQADRRREEFTCSGCHMNLTLEQVNALRSRDDIQLCNTCGRILYLEAPVESRT